MRCSRAGRFLSLGIGNRNEKTAVETTGEVGCEHDAIMFLDHFDTHLLPRRSGFPIRKGLETRLREYSG